MKKLFILSSILVLLAGCSIGGQKQEALIEVSGTSIFQKKIDTASSKIKNSPEFEACMAPVINSCINSVGVQLAQKQKDISICNELSQPEQKEGCKFAIIVGEANEKGDPSLCDRLTGDYKHECSQAIYRTIAIQRKDISYCQKMIEGQEKSLRTDEDFDQCALNILITKENTASSECSVLRGDPMKKTCTDAIKKKTSNTPR